MKNYLDNFFESHILPLHNKKGAEENNLLDTRFRIQDDSYFSVPQHPQYLYLTSVPFENETELEAYLRDFWKDEPELLNMIPDLLSLRMQLKQEHTDVGSELSPFVYAMF